MASHFRVIVNDATSLMVIHTSMKQCLETPGKVEWSDILEVPRLPKVKGENIIRIRFGTVAGHAQYKRLVQFVDEENADSRSKLLGNYGLDFIQGQECYSAIVSKQTLATFDTSQAIACKLSFQEDSITFDTQRLIEKSGRGRLTIASHDKPINSSNTYDAGIGLDIQLAIGCQTINASKYVLCQFSPVFAAMFASDNWQESENNKVQIESIDFEVMTQLIRALHGIPCKVGVLTALQMLIIADKYLITDVQRQIEDNIKTNITADNVIQVLKVADTLNLESLKLMAFDFLRRRNYGKVCDLNQIESVPTHIILKVMEILETKLQSFYKSRKLL